MKNYSLLRFSKVCTLFYQNLSGKGDSCIHLSNNMDLVIGKKTLTLGKKSLLSFYENVHDLFLKSFSFFQSKKSIEVNNNTEISLHSAGLLGLLCVNFSMILCANTIGLLHK